MVLGVTLFFSVVFFSFVLFQYLMILWVYLEPCKTFTSVSQTAISFTNYNLETLESVG